MTKWGDKQKLCHPGKVTKVTNKKHFVTHFVTRENVVNTNDTKER